MSDMGGSGYNPNVAGSAAYGNYTPYPGTDQQYRGADDGDGAEDPEVRMGGTGTNRRALKDNEWACVDAKCSTINYNWRKTCSKCGKTKPKGQGKVGIAIGKDLAEKSKGLFAAEDWACTKCGNINWARRSTCNICNAPKLGEQEARTGYGGGYMDRQEVEYVRRNDDDDDEFDEFGRRKKKRQPQLPQTAGAATHGDAQDEERREEKENELENRGAEINPPLPLHEEIKRTRAVSADLMPTMTPAVAPVAVPPPAHLVTAPTIPPPVGETADTNGSTQVAVAVVGVSAALQPELPEVEDAKGSGDGAASPKAMAATDDNDEEEEDDDDDDDLSKYDLTGWGDDDDEDTDLAAIIKAKDTLPTVLSATSLDAQPVSRQQRPPPPPSPLSSDCSCSCSGGRCSCSPFTDRSRSRSRERVNATTTRHTDARSTSRTRDTSRHAPKRTRERSPEHRSRSTDRSRRRR